MCVCVCEREREVNLPVCWKLFDIPVVYEYRSDTVGIYCLVSVVYLYVVSGNCYQLYGIYMDDYDVWCAMLYIR